MDNAVKTRERMSALVLPLTAALYIRARSVAKPVVCHVGWRSSSRWDLCWLHRRRPSVSPRSSCI
jgi:hypothetical protein